LHANNITLWPPTIDHKTAGQRHPTNYLPPTTPYTDLDNILFFINIENKCGKQASWDPPLPHCEVLPSLQKNWASPNSVSTEFETNNTLHSAKILEIGLKKPCLYLKNQLAISAHFP
jgi:hypothetical protein